MIIWLASYPKSGNTWVRSFLASYYFSEDGRFDSKLLKNFKQFPGKDFIKDHIADPGIVANYWRPVQESIIKNNKFTFLKTHNCLMLMGDKKFTTTKYTAGVIYVIRDPRNVLTSFKNHYNKSYEETLKIMTKQDMMLYDNTSSNYNSTQFISSWSNHYKTWLNSNPFKKILIKYEDLQLNSHNIFRELIKFTNDLLGFDKHIDDKKFTNAIETTNFENLKNEETKGNFSENVYSDQGKKINFFHLGFKNKWEKLLPANIRSEANKQFEKDIKHFNYTT